MFNLNLHNLTEPWSLKYASMSRAKLFATFKYPVCKRTIRNSGSVSRLTKWISGFIVNVSGP